MFAEEALRDEHALHGVAAEVAPALHEGHGHQAARLDIDGQLHEGSLRPAPRQKAHSRLMPT